MKYFSALFGVFFSTVVFSDVKVDDYPLGMSSEELTQRLLKDGFYIYELSKDSIKAKKLAIDLNDFSNSKNPDEAKAEFPQFSVSTDVEFAFCEKKLYRETVQSFYYNELINVWAARKSIYKYLDDNKAVQTDIRLSQTDEDNNVGFAYKIDRSALGGSAKGEENVTVQLYVPTKPNDRRRLSMKYRLENKWFCPE